MCKEKQPAEITKQIQEYIPLSCWNKYYDYPTVKSLRMFYFYNTGNFNRVIRKIGKRLYIKTSDFFKWVEEQNNIA